METNASWQTPPSITLPEALRHLLSGDVRAGNDGAIRMVAASVQNWPELTVLGLGDVVFGGDGLIRVALWSASNACATLMATRRATLLLGGGGFWEIRCLVLAIASLATPRPLSGFLLQPIEIFDGYASRRGLGLQGTRRRPKAIRDRAGGTRLALFDAFPVDDDGEHAPPGRSP